MCVLFGSRECCWWLSSAARLLYSLSASTSVAMSSCPVAMTSAFFADSQESQERLHLDQDSQNALELQGADFGTATLDGADGGASQDVLPSFAAELPQWLAGTGAGDQPLSQESAVSNDSSQQRVSQHRRSSLVCLETSGTLQVLRLRVPAAQMEIRPNVEPSAMCLSCLALLVALVALVALFHGGLVFLDVRVLCQRRESNQCATSDPVGCPRRSSSLRAPQKNFVTLAACGPRHRRPLRLGLLHRHCRSS